MIALERQAISCVAHHFEVVSLYAIWAANGIGIGHVAEPNIKA